VARREWTLEELTDGVRGGDRRALARAISLVENGDPLAYPLVRDLYPATGSAAAAFAGLLVRTLALDQGEYRFAIEQGYEMGRPSLIELVLTMRSGTLRLATVGGAAVVVTEGTIEA